MIYNLVGFITINITKKKKNCQYDTFQKSYMYFNSALEYGYGLSKSGITTLCYTFTI